MAAAMAPLNPNTGQLMSVTPKVRVLVDYLAEEFRGRSWADA